ncbi:FXYD domain-containing ion transport regulator 3 [Larimichthys crocea]|uniref:Uncharacterized protein n=1 Tax=Larimichthys crocea TaxID=215358 RepID=A0ACD3QUA4_LARCR|nr:FXYD domain-containing ion transport regulator 3 [Larimichthys crocea]
MKDTVLKTGRKKDAERAGNKKRGTVGDSVTEPEQKSLYLWTRQGWRSGSAGNLYTRENKLLYYHRLRVGGLILAAVLCLIGITILFSGHCRCKFNQDKRRRAGSNAQQMLSDQGRSCDC